MKEKENLSEEKDSLGILSRDKEFYVLWLCFRALISNFLFLGIPFSILFISLYMSNILSIWTFIWCEIWIILLIFIWSIVFKKKT